MPRHIVPHKSSVHRVAAIALYRALITQCRALSLDPPLGDELQNIVRNRFKQSRHDGSVPRLRLSFEAGYEAVDRLDAAVAGDATSKQYILDLLDRAPSKVKQTPPVVLPIKLQKELDAQKRKLDKEAREKERPPHLSIWDRPLPLDQLSGPRRRVPVLFSAGGAVGVPVLRFKKPQSPHLSGYIADRTKRRQAWADRRQRLFTELDIARHEDQWDDIVGRKLGNRGKNKDSEAWQTVVKEALGDSTRHIEREHEKDREMAWRMQEVVRKEQELADKEKADRDEVKRAKRKAKQEEARWLAERAEQREARRATVDELWTSKPRPPIPVEEVTVKK